MMKQKGIIDVEEITKVVKGRKIIDNMSFQVHKGDICGIIGPNGAGKTTLIRMLTGLVRPNSGTIEINGYNINKERKNALNEMGSIVETPVFFPYMSGKRNLLNLGRLYITSQKELQQKVKDAIHLVGLTGRENDKVEHYSLGMKQRLGIAQAILNNPRLIILDEPANGLDPLGMRDLRDMIFTLRDEQSMTFLISSHLIKELEVICNRWVMINNGKIIWQGSGDQLRDVDDIEEKLIEMMSS